MSVHYKIADEDRNRASIAEWLEAHHLDIAGQAAAARCDGRLLDLNGPLPEAPEVEILTFDDEEGREVFRHTASHVMAQAVKRLVPAAKLAIGPAIGDGFYYDFDSPEAFSPEFLERVEAEMRKIIAAGYPTERVEMSRDEAIRFFGDRGENYKVELLEDIGDQSVSCYRQDDFVDLCRGPHLPSTGRVGAFKLLSVAGAYWRGDERRPMLQRIYATAFPTQEMLDEHLRMREEAAKRDHRKLGRELDLFSIQEAVGPGLALWHPRGALIRELIEDFWRREHRRRGYDIVITPHIGKATLWEKSGHLDHFAESMYGPMMVEDEEYRIKPMNCPFHLLIYKSQVRSYRDLPIRLAELGTVYRYERSGVLEGLLRVRCFTQDDAHIFCTPEQMPAEILGVLDFALYMMRTFGYEYLEVELATRDEEPGSHYLGEDADWESAQAMLGDALRARGVDYKIGAGEAKFYGPSIDIKLKDCVGKLWQGPTIQFDFNEPKRFDVTYVGEDGQHHHCLMIHRVVLGAMERFIAGLVEHYGGAFPLWLSPVQVMVIPITDRQHDYAREVHGALAARGIRAQVDDRKESMRLKIREAQLQKVPYMLVVGDREVEQRAVSVRERAQGDLGTMDLEAFVTSIEQEARPPDSRR